MAVADFVMLNLGFLARRLWHRSVVRPPLTPADKQPLVAIARREERRPGESVAVGFERKAAHGQLA
jgi:hypothetical protein